MKTFRQELRNWLKEKKGNETNPDILTLIEEIIEKTNSLEIERKPQYKRNDTYIYESKKWTVYNDVEDNEFKPLVDKVIELNESCFITGPADTGKSQLIRQIKQEHE